MQPFVVTLCGLLIYRGIARFYTADATAGFAFGQTFPDARMADHRAHATACRISFFACW